MTTHSADQSSTSILKYIRRNHNNVSDNKTYSLIAKMHFAIIACMLSFNIFSLAELLCSLTGIKNSIERLRVRIDNKSVGHGNKIKDLK